MSFSSIPHLTAKPPPIDPIEIFARRPSLPGTPNDLWGGQREALLGWTRKRKKRDILISLNTGSGKTILGALIAQSLANEPGGKCVYVCSTIDLVNQTEREARKLGISPTTWYSGEFNNLAFEQGKTFCITTYSSIFNAQRPFRKHNATKFVFDDAHVAEKAIRDSFTITILRSTYSALHKQITDLLAPLFVKVGQSFAYRDLLEGRSTSIMLVPPMFLLEVADEISEAIRSIDLKRAPALLFPYLYLKDQIKLCAITVSQKQLEITPPFLPTPITYPFSQDEMRRVYLSATLQTQAEFARAFGRSPDEIIAPETDAGNGERCILFGNYVADEDTGSKLVADIKLKQKLVIMCRSYSDARAWAPIATILERERFSSELEQFRRAHSGAIILVARVDGIDLPDEACRVMLIDGLPSGYSQIERFQIEYCAMTSLGATKLASRITQAFGRINRGRKDYGVFILRGRSLNNWLGDARNRALLPELLQKQILLGEQVSINMIKGGGSAAILSVMDAVMVRDEEWIKAYGDRIADAELPVEAKALAEETDSLLTAAAITEVRAMQEAWQGGFSSAAAVLDQASEKTAVADSRLAGWHNLWQGWFYDLAGDHEAALREYDRASSRLGRAIFLPRPKSLQIEGQPITARGSRFAGLVSESHASRFEKEMGILVKRFAPLAKPGSSAAEHEEATRALGEALGFSATRPDNVFRTGPDVLWVDEEEKVCLLFELKTLQQGPKPLTKTIVSKGHDHVQWVKDNHPNINISGLIFVSDSTSCYDDANPSDLMWVGQLSAIRTIADDFIKEIKIIRNALPLERLIKSSAYAADVRVGIVGLRERLASCHLQKQGSLREHTSSSNAYEVGSGNPSN